MSSQPTAKQARELAGFRQAGLDKDRSQIPALLATLKNPPERFYVFTSLHTLAQLGAPEALPAVNSLLATSHDIDLVNYATAAKARLLAESGAQAVKDPKARARAKLAALYQGTGLTPEALGQAARVYKVYASTPGEPVPVGVYVLREAADILYQGGVASSEVEIAPPDYSLDPAAALKVQMAPLSPKERINALVERMVHGQVSQQAERYAVQLLADLGPAAEQAVDDKVVDMDQHQEQYNLGGFGVLFDVLRGIGDPSQGPFVGDLAQDQSRASGQAAAKVLADIVRGNNVVFAVGY